MHITASHFKFIALAYSATPPHTHCRTTFRRMPILSAGAQAVTFENNLSFYTRGALFSARRSRPPPHVAAIVAALLTAIPHAPNKLTSSTLTRLIMNFRTSTLAPHFV